MMYLIRRFVAWQSIGRGAAFKRVPSIVDAARRREDVARTQRPSAFPAYLAPFVKRLPGFIGRLSPLPPSSFDVTLPDTLLMSSSAILSSREVRDVRCGLNLVLLTGERERPRTACSVLRWSLLRPRSRDSSL